MYKDGYRQIYGTYYITQDMVAALARIGITLHLLPRDQWPQGYYLDDINQQRVYPYPYGCR